MSSNEFKVFPGSLPLPLQSGYRRKHSPNMLRTAMADGYARQRLINPGAPDELSVSFVFTASQYRYFLDWYKSEIASGADWFVMPVLATEDGGGEIAYQYARIKDGELSVDIKSTHPELRTIYGVSCTLDVSNTVRDDGTWAGLWKSGGGDEYAEVGGVFSERRQAVEDDEIGDDFSGFEIVEQGGQA